MTDMGFGQTIEDIKTVQKGLTQLVPVVISLVPALASSNIQEDVPIR